MINQMITKSEVTMITHWMSITKIQKANKNVKIWVVWDGYRSVKVTGNNHSIQRVRMGVTIRLYHKLLLYLVPFSSYNEFLSKVACRPTTIQRDLWHH